MKSNILPLLLLLLLAFGRAEAQDATAAKVETRIQLMFHNQFAGSRSAAITFNGQTVTTRAVAGIDQYSFNRTVVPGTKNLLKINKDSGIAYSYAIIANGYVVFAGTHPAPSNFINDRSGGEFQHPFVLSEKDVSGVSGGAPLGMELEPSVADLEWMMGLGQTRNGEEAGYLAVRDDTLGDATHHRSMLAACLSPTAYGEFELIHTDEDSDGLAESLRQIKTKRNLIDVVDLPSRTGYTITVREGGTRAGSSGPYTPSGATLVSYQIERVNPTLLRITRNEPGTSRTVVTEFEKPASGTNEWILRKSGGPVTKTTEVERAATSGGFVRTWTHSYSTAPSGHPAAASQFKLRRVYANLDPVDGFQPTPRVVEETTDPGTAGAEATTIYSYYDGTAAHLRGVYGMLRGMKGSYGDWRIFDYYNFSLVSVTPDINDPLYVDAFYDLWRFAIANQWYEVLHPVSLLSGSVRRVYRTGGDDFPVNIAQGPEQFSGAANGVEYVLEHHTVGFDWDEFSTTTLNRASTRAASNNLSVRYNQLVGLEARMPTLAPLNHAGATSSDFVQITRDYYNHSFAGNWIANSSANTPAMALSGRLVPSRHDPGFDYRKAFRPWYEVERDNAKTSYAYRGIPNYRGISNAWCEFAVTGTQVKAKDNWQITIQPQGRFTYTRRTILFEQAYPFLEGPGVTYPSAARNSSYNDLRARLFSPVSLSHAFESGSGTGSLDFTVDNLNLVAGKSVKTARIFDEAGNMRYVEKWVRVGSAWQLLSLRTLSYDGFGRVTQVDEQKGQGAPTRTLYEAGYEGLVVSYEVDALGNRTDHLYDSLGRHEGTIKSSKNGSGEIPGAGQNSLTVGVSLDCLDRVIQTRVGEPDGIVSGATTYDFTGRVRSGTDQNGVTSTHSYTKETGAGLRIDVSMPEGIQQTHIHHQDGKSKSSTGSGLVPAYHTHGYEFGSGNRPFATTSSGSSDGSGPQTTVTWNWLGQMTRHRQSTSVAAWDETSHTYLTSNARLSESMHTEVSENGATTSQATRTIHEYDAFGSLTASGVDVNANGSLNDASTDLITRGDSIFVETGGQIHREGIQRSFTADGSAGSVSTVTRTQLTGLAANVLADTTLTDIHGNPIREIVTLERNAARITATTSHSDGTGAVSVSEMGFPKSDTARHGQTRFTEYDAYGRVILLKSTEGGRSFSTRIIPEAGKFRPLKTITDLAHDGTGAGRAFEYGYDAAGRRNLTLLPGGESVHLAYDTRSLPVKTWGTGTRAEWFVRDPLNGWLTEHHKWQSQPGEQPDLAGATTPPAGSTVTRYTHFPKSGQISSRTLAHGTPKASTTTFTYDALGNLRTRGLPGNAGDSETTATSPVTVTMTWHPKTSRLTGISYNDAVTTDLSFTHSRSGTQATVTEKPKGGAQVTRTLHHHLSGNGSAALRMIAEDLPAYYQTIPALAVNDTAHTATRIIHGHTGSATMGRISSTALGTPGGSPGALAATRMGTSYSYGDGLLTEISVGAAQPVTYAYEPGGNLIRSRTSSPALLETTERHSLRNVVSSNQTTGAGEIRVSHQYALDGNGQRQSVTRSGTQYAGYGGSLHEVFYRGDALRLGRATTHAGGSANAPVLPGRDISYVTDGADNLLSIQRPDAPAGAGAGFGVNALDQFPSRQNPSWVEIAGTLARPKNVAVRDPLADGPLVPKRMTDYFHAWKEIPGSALRSRDVELLSSHPGAGAPDPANPGKNLDRLTIDPLRLHARPASEPVLHDARGNLVSDALWTYTWDANNRLVSIEGKPAAIAAGRLPVKLGFRYDWLGRRVMKEHFTHDGTAFAAKPSKVTLFWWDGWNLLREASYSVTWGAVNPTAAAFIEEIRYHRGPDLAGRLHGLGGIGGLVATQRRLAGQAPKPPRYPAYDGNGNIVAMLDAAGNSVAEFDYDPYGRTLRAGGEEEDRHRVRFATQYHDPETGLYYHQFRYYDPGAGRFLSRDPAGASGNLHPYAYADNNPVDGVDAFGLATYFQTLSSRAGASSSTFIARPRGNSGGGFSGATVYVGSNQNFSNALRRGLPAVSSRPPAASSHMGAGSGHPFDSRADLTVVSAAFGSSAAMDPRYSYRHLMELGQKEFRLEKEMIAGQILIARIEGRSGSMQFGRLADELDKMGPGYESLAADARRIKYAKQDAEFDYSILSKTATGIGMIADLALVGVPPIFTTGKIGTSGIRAAGAGDDLVGITTRTTGKFEMVPYSGQPMPGAWPGNRGFLGSSSKVTLEPGTVIDRYGFRSGSLVSPQGTPFPMRALPDETLSKPFEAYRVRTALEVDGGLVAPAFGKPGLGTQYELPFSVNELIQLRVLELFTP